MRTFEVLLILANLFSLFLSFKKRSKGTWLVIAGINLLIFCLHAIFESLRYQMVFSYALVFLLAVYALARGNGRIIKTRTIKAFKVAAVSLAFVFLGITSFLAYALPVFTLPKPTGIYPVGIQYFHLIDQKRLDAFLNPPTKKRELMVKIYYPAKGNYAKPYSPYFHGSKELIRLFTAGFGLPDFMFSHLSLVKTNSKEGLALYDQPSRYPVVLFSHGAGTGMETQTSQCEDLASHGYIVVAIDHTYVSGATVFPDRIASAREATTDFNTAEPAEIITQIMADDAEFVIETLGEMNAGKIASIFQGKLNLNEIGIAGHSVGGAVAYNLAINDRRIKAAIDLDGTVFITPKAGSKDIAPFLMLANDKQHIQIIQNGEILMKKFSDMTVEEKKMLLSMYGSEAAYQKAYHKAQQNMIGLTEVLRESGNLFTIEGSDHMKFIDIGLFFGSRPLRELIGIGGKTDPSKCLEITKAVTLAFFDQHLKNETNDPIGTLLIQYPELKKVNLAR